MDFPGGTEGYIPPEQLLLSSKASISTDIYALGKIIEFLSKGSDLKEIAKRCTSASSDDRPKLISDIPLLIKKSQRKRSAIRWGILAAITLIIGGAYLAVSLDIFRKDHKEVRSVDGERSEIVIARSDTLAGSHPTNISASQTDDRLDDMIPGDKVEEVSIHTENKDIKEIAEASDSGDEVVSGKEERYPLANADDQELRRKFSDKFEDVMARRFKEQLNFIDTMTTPASYRLQYVDHWQWQAKKEMEAWLKTMLPPGDYRIKEEMEKIDGYIDFWSGMSHRKDLIASARTKAYKRKAIGVSTERRYFRDKATYVIKTFEKDGKWHERVIKVPLFYTTEAEAEELRWEYVKKALGE